MHTDATGTPNAAPLATSDPTVLPVKPSDLTKDTFWGVHLSTAIILMIVAGVLLGIDMLVLPLPRAQLLLGTSNSTAMFSFVVIALNIDVLALVAIFCEIRIRVSG